MSRLDADAERAKGKIASLGEERASPQLGLDSSAFDAGLDRSREKFGQFHEAVAKPRLGLDDDEFREKIDRDKADMDEMGGKRASPKVGLDDGEFKAQLAQDTSSFRAFGLLTAHPLISAMVGGVSALLPGIGAGLAGLGLLGGAGELAFGPILKALQAHQQGVQQSASSSGQMGAQLAATQFQNAVAIQQAQQAVQSAMQQSAQDAKTSAQAIISAEQQVGQAEHQLGDAQFSERDAQVNLTNARIAARLTLQQLNDAQKDSVLSTRAAKLALEQAEQQQAQTDQNAMSTQLDREQAALAVAQAHRQVTEAEQNQANSREAADRANKAGVNGSQQVIDAQHALRDAVYGVKAAEQALANARRAVANAEEQAAYQAKRDAEAVAQAQRNVKDMIIEQRLQMAATLASEQGAMAQFGQDYANLSPQAQAFVNQLLDAQKAYHGLQLLAEQTIIPGASIALKGLMSDLPVIRTAVRGIGHMIGGWLADFGKIAQTPAFKTGLGNLLHQGQQFAKIVVPAFGRFIGTLGKAAGSKGAASGLADLVAGVAKGVSGIVNGVKGAIPDIDKFFGGVAKLLPYVGKDIGDIVAGIAKIAGPVMKELEPGLQSIFANLGPAFLQISKDVAPVFQGAAKVVSQILITGSPILEFISKLVGWFMKAGHVVGDAITGNFKDLPKSLDNIAGGMGNVVKAGEKVGGWLEHSKDTALTAYHELTGDDGWGGFFSFFGQMVGVTSRGTKSMSGNLGNVKQSGIELTSSFRTQTGEQSSIWSDFIGLFEGNTSGFASWVAQHWDSLMAGLKASLGNGVQALKTTWAGLEADFRGPVDYLIGTVYDKGMLPLWNDVVGAVGLGSLKLKPLSGFAAGGIHPGRDSGRDDYLVKVRGGEGFLSPEAVRGVGPGFVGAVNAFFGRGGRGSAGVTGGIPGFAHGGILGGIFGKVENWVDKGLSGLGHLFSGGFDFVTKLVTDPAGAITGLLDKVIGTTAKGNLGAVMRGIPHTLIGDLAKGFAHDSPLSSLGDGTQGGLGGTATGRQIVNFGESWIGKIPYVFGGNDLAPGGEVDCSGYTGGVYRHFGFDPPRTSELQYQWVDRTPGPVLGGLAFFTGSPVDPPPGHVGIVTGTDQMVDAYGTGFGVRLNSIYGSSGSVMGFGVPPGGGLLGKTLGGGKGRFGTTYDSGGWMMPGGPNQTGRPEAVLNPDESQAIVTLARELVAQRGTGKQVVVNQNYYGPQMPTAEQLAVYRRDLALMLGG